jgi:membrane associated rhomboid family serine protease
MPYYTSGGNYYRPSMFGGFGFFPPVIKILMITNAIVFVLVAFLGSFRLDGMPLEGALNQYLGLMPLGYGFYPWQLLTYQFMHADIWHLFFNMFFGLWMFGMEIEHVWGSRKFLIFYLLCGFVAGISQLVLAPILDPSSLYIVHPMTGEAVAGVPTIGASGAVYGVLIAFGMLFPDRYIFLYFLVPVKAKYFVAGLIVLGIFSVGGSSPVAHLAHLGGALAGALYIMNDTGRLPLQGLFDRMAWWMNSRRYRKTSDEREEIVDTKVFDIRKVEKEDESVTQQQIDEILDKITRGGYQSLTEEEKKILFEASKKLN